MLTIFDIMRIEDKSVRDWFRAVLASQTKDDQAESKAKRVEVQRQETLLVEQQDRLLNLRLGGEIDQDVFAKKCADLRDRLARIKLQLEAVDRAHDENTDLASQIVELSHTLRSKWLTVDYGIKRRILEIVCLNCELVDASPCVTMRKPFHTLQVIDNINETRNDEIRKRENLRREDPRVSSKSGKKN